MGFVTLGIFAFNMHGLYGAMIVMLSHGLVTGALFLCVGVIYERGAHATDQRFRRAGDRMPVYAAIFGVFMLASIGPARTDRASSASFWRCWADLRRIAGPAHYRDVRRHPVSLVHDVDVPARRLQPSAGRAAGSTLI